MKMTKVGDQRAIVVVIVWWSGVDHDVKADLSEEEEEEVVVFGCVVMLQAGVDE